MKVELTTIGGKKFNVSQNISHRTFTICLESGKYKTDIMSKEEFTKCLYYTGKEWQNYLLTNKNYYKVK
jgi:hypothetical protein